MSWTLIESQTLGSSAASVTFSAIPQTFKTLKIVYSTRFATAAANSATISFNGSASSFSDRILYGTGSSAASGSYALNLAGVGVGSGDTASTFSNGEIVIPNYAGSTNKPYSGDGVNETNATTAYQLFDAGLWSSTAAITSITLAPQSGNWATNSSFTLYGLK